ncbi:phage tail protein [Telluribacter humicola]|uniref:phage tail protein n=1 Tax=Telluribacter humicola TaxID=1720261 RepID=UPI001A95D688|nr:tail fiber protein [Telluribacter humicola]
MAEPYLSEIKIVSFNFPPKGWAHCNGQLLPINQNQALFSLLGTTYGGNGQTNFALPNFQGRVPIHFGNTNTLGTTGGEEFHTVTTSELPQHTHQFNAVSTTSFASNTNSPIGTYFSTTNPNQLYRSAGGNTQLTTLTPASISNVGGSQPHENRQPYLVLNFIIALQGIFPTRN